MVLGMKPTTKTLALVTAALAPTEAILRKEFERQLAERVVNMLNELKLDGWDAQKRYAYPEGNMSRVAYLAQKARYDLCSKYTVTKGGSYSPRGPRIVSPKAWSGMVAKEAAEMAKAALEGYCAKLAAKIDATGIKCEKVEYKGGLNPWGVSSIWVNSVAQEWQTKMIINISCLGKLFNQWPTRLMK